MGSLGGLPGIPQIAYSSPKSCPAGAAGTAGAAGSEAPAANDRYVATLNGSDLSPLDKNNGKLIWRREVRGAVGAGPAMSERYVFVPMIDGTIEAYDIEDYRQPPWVFQSHGRAMTQPIYTGKYIAWTTDRGHLNVARGNENTILYRVETETSIAAEATVLPPDKLLVAAVDGYVYCINAERGSVAWRFSSGEPIFHTPIVLGENVYAITDDGSMFAISGDRGEEVWRTTGVRQFVAASRDRLYCRDARNGLAVLESPAAGCWEPYRLRPWISRSSTSRPIALSSAPAKA